MGLTCSGIAGRERKSSSTAGARERECPAVVVVMPVSPDDLMRPSPDEEQEPASPSPPRPALLRHAAGKTRRWRGAAATGCGHIPSTKVSVETRRNKMVQVVLIRPSRSIDQHFTRSTGLRERVFLQVEFESQDVSNWYSLNSMPISLICQARPNFSTCSHYIFPVTQT